MRAEAKAKSPLFLCEKNILASPCSKYTSVFPAHITPIIMLSSQEQLLMYKTRQAFQERWAVAWFWRLPWGVQKGLTFQMCWTTICPAKTAPPMQTGHPEMTAHLQHVGCGRYIPRCPMPCALQVEKIYLPEQNLLNLCLFKEIKNHWSRLETVF